MKVWQAWVRSMQAQDLVQVASLEQSLQFNAWSARSFQASLEAGGEGWVLEGGWTVSPDEKKATVVATFDGIDLVAGERSVGAREGAPSCQSTAIRRRFSKNVKHEASSYERSSGDFSIINQEVIVGYALVSVVLPEAEILTWGVAAAWQGLGFGRCLFRWLLLQSLRPRVARVFLEVRPSNAPALSLYFSFGFEKVGVRPAYYPAPGGGREDAWVLTKDLSNLSAGP